MCDCDDVIPASDDVVVGEMDGSVVEGLGCTTTESMSDCGSVCVKRERR